MPSHSSGPCCLTGPRQSPLQRPVSALVASCSCSDGPRGLSRVAPSKPLWGGGVAGRSAGPGLGGSFLPWPGCQRRPCGHSQGRGAPLIPTCSLLLEPRPGSELHGPGGYEGSSLCPAASVVLPQLKKKRPLSSAAELLMKLLTASSGPAPLCLTGLPARL